MKRMLRVAYRASVIALAAPSSAQSPSRQPAPLFEASDPIHLKISGAFSTLARNRQGGPTPGTLIDPSGQSLPINLSARGITRRSTDICDFPPLRVDFTAPPPATSVFARQKRLKLVTHCRRSESFQQYVLLEYSAYRMFNLLSPKSFRVRLANIDYVDADGRPYASRIGFFIEDLGDVAKRNGTKETKAPERIAAAALNPMDAARYALFQHMLGNHDWSMRAGPAGDECCHNAKLIGPLAQGSVTPIPYDFDFSGMVDPPYATPPAELHINSVRQRQFRGYCFHNSQTLAVAAQMRAAHPAIVGVLDQTPGLDPRTRSRAANYLEGFFADIASDADVSAKVLKRCVG
jgi:hypothetical protein